MKYFYVSLVTIKSLILLFGNRDKDKHKLSERNRRRQNLNVFEKVIFTIRINQFLLAIIQK